MSVVIKIQWNVDLTKGQETWGFIISRFFSIYFTITGVNKSFVITRTSLHRGSLHRGSTVILVFFLGIISGGLAFILLVSFSNSLRVSTQGGTHLSEISGSTPNPHPRVLALLRRCCLPKRRAQDKLLYKVFVVGGWFIIWSQPFTFNMHALSFTYSSLLKNKALCKL